VFSGAKNYGEMHKLPSFSVLSIAAAIRDTNVIKDVVLLVLYHGSWLTCGFIVS
jgi:hypothetical protein